METLLENCRHIENVQALDVTGVEGLRFAHCAGYLRGSLIAYNTMFTLFPNIRLFCTPEATSFKLITRVVLRWIEQHPEHHHESGASAALTAWIEAFPCTEAKETR